MRLFAISLAFAVSQLESSANMQVFVDRGRVAGIVTIFDCKGKVTGPFAVGYQDLEARRPMRPDTIFQVMSMTKPITSVGIMMLVEDGLLALSDPVEKYLPEFRGVSHGGRTLVIQDLLTHTSGMIGNPPARLADLYTKMQLSLGDAVSMYAREPLVFTPGSRWMYSNPGMATLGRLIEVRSGKSYEKFIEERIFGPLAMRDSFFFVPDDKKSRVAFVYGKGSRGRLTRDPGSLLGGASAKLREGAVYPAPEFGLYSTASDMNAFHQAMLNGSLLTQASMDTMTSIHTRGIQAGWNSGAGFGLGWEVVDHPEGFLASSAKGTYYHGGAFGTFGWVDPTRKLTGVFLVQGGASLGARNAFVQTASASCEN